jgi:hypothetical protein
MRRLLNILQEPFPYYLNDDKKNAWLITGFSVFMVVFLIVLLPMKLIWVLKFSLIGAVIFAVLFPTILWFPKIFPKIINPETWTIGKYILFTFFQLMIIGIVTPILIHVLNFHPELSLWMNVKYFFIEMMMYGSFSIILFTFILRNVMLKNSLRRALHANEELEKIRGLKYTPAIANPPQNITIQSDTSETAYLNPEELLYIEASDNYSTLYWKSTNGLQKKMLRVNLKNIETQLDNPLVVRCHRSYMVNINAITEVEGNTNGYRLSLRDTDFTVPVSRGKGREVIEKIEQIRNMAESV